MPLSRRVTTAWYCSAHESPIRRTSAPCERAQSGGMLPPWRNELACVWPKCDSRTARSALDRSEATAMPSGANSSSSQPWAMARLDAVGTGQRVYQSAVTGGADDGHGWSGLLGSGMGSGSAERERARTRGMTSAPKRRASASSGWNWSIRSSMPAAWNAAIRSATWS